MHINHSVKGSLPYLHCACTKKSNSVPEKKWGDCNCCSQKGFYSIQVEKLNAGELVQCFVEEESLLATAFHVVQSQCVRTLNVGVKRKAPCLPRMLSVYL